MINLQIEWTLNNILVPNLDNHNKEYLKLFRIWKIEIEKLLEEQKNEIIEKIVKMVKDRKGFDIRSEYVSKIDKTIKLDEKPEYIEWYNQALKNINESIENIAEVLENNLIHLLK